MHACIYLYRVCGKKNVENVLCERAFIIAVWRAVWDEGGCFRCSVFLNTHPHLGVPRRLFYEGVSLAHLILLQKKKKNITHFPSRR